MNKSPRLLLVDLFAPCVVDFAVADQRVKQRVEQELRGYVDAGATDAQIHRETIRRYRRIFYTPDMIATWRLCMGVRDQIAAVHRQGYQIVFFGEHLQRAYLSIEHWCQEHFPGVPFSLALNDLPFYIEEKNVFLLGTEMFEGAGWAFCLILTVVRLFRAAQTVVLTQREQVQEHYEQAREDGNVPEIRIVKSLNGLEPGQ
jgi:hypothetical protein